MRAWILPLRYEGIFFDGAAGNLFTLLRIAVAVFSSIWLRIFYNLVSFNFYYFWIYWISFLARLSSLLIWSLTALFLFTLFSSFGSYYTPSKTTVSSLSLKGYYISTDLFNFLCDFYSISPKDLFNWLSLEYFSSLLKRHF